MAALAWLLNLGFAGGGGAVAVGPPYTTAAGETRAHGGVVGQNRVDGQGPGEILVTGDEVGQIDGRGS